MDNYVAKIGDKYFLGGDNQGALARLFDYEATGLLPAEIVGMGEKLEEVYKVLDWVCLQCGYEPGWDECIKCPVHEWRNCDVMTHSEIIKIASAMQIPHDGNRVLSLSEVLALPEGGEGVD